MENLAFLLLNIMFSLLPFLLVGTFSRRPGQQPDSLRTFVYFGPAMVGCMAFPFAAGSSAAFDASVIPLLTGSLYGGLSAALTLSAAAGVVRHLLSGDGGFAALFVCLAAASGATLLRARLFAAEWPRKLIWWLPLAAIAASAQFAEAAWNDRASLWEAGTEWWPLLLHAALLLAALVTGEHLRETVNERMRQEKLTANRSLAVIIAHELRNPLTTVHGFLQLIKRQLPAERTLQYVDTAMQELNEAEKIIDMYLTITALQEAEREEVHVADCIDDALEELWPAIEHKGIDLVNAVSEDVTLYCNKEQLHMCLKHLLRNGMNAVHAKGKLTASSYWKGKELAIVISDNGVGMTEDQLLQLGMPKYNTSSSGTGTGLMYCYHFVHSLQGRIRIQSQPGRGTAVTITFPWPRAR